jgi:hypothetical protein
MIYFHQQSVPRHFASSQKTGVPDLLRGYRIVTAPHIVFRPLSRPPYKFPKFHTFQVTRFGKPGAAVKRENFNLLSVDIDRFCLRDQHGGDDMEYNGHHYTGSMYFDDIGFCYDVDMILKSNLGRSMKDIGDLDLSHLL